MNYYFGGKESLYEEVLLEAHRQVMRLEELDAILAADDAPEEKLRASVLPPTVPGSDRLPDDFLAYALGSIHALGTVAEWTGSPLPFPKSFFRPAWIS